MNMLNLCLVFSVGLPCFGLAAGPSRKTKSVLPHPTEPGTPFDYFQNSWNVIGLKDYNDGTRVTPENEFLLAHKVKLRISCGPNRTPLSRKQTKTALDGWLPILLWTAEIDGVRYEFTSWATPLPSVKDWKAAFDGPTEGENFLNWIQVRAINVSQTESRAALRLDFIGTNSPAPREWLATLHPGRAVETCFRIPFSPIAEAASFDRENPRRWRQRTANFWRNLLSRAASIEVPCEKSTQALKAAHVCQFIANDHGVLHGGEGFYDEFYIRDGGYQILELEEAGLFDDVRKALKPYLESQRPDGRFETQKGQFDANGQALWVLWQYWKITGDAAWLRQVYPQMRRAALWIKNARSQTAADPKFPGLLPNAVADGEYLWDGKHHIVGYDFWNLRGLRCTAEAARAIGEGADARDFEREARDYHEAINRASEKTGLKHFPPSWEKAGTHWGNTEVLWPTELFPADDPRISALQRHVRTEHGGGFAEGTIRWTGYTNAIHPYMSSYTTMNSLVRGEHDQFVEDYYWYLVHSTAAHAFPEGVFFQRRFAWSDTIPHVTGAANFAFLLRHALLHERGEELHLLSGAPDAWLQPEQEIRIRNAPTHFGVLGLTVIGTRNGVKIDLDSHRFGFPASGGTHRAPPKQIILHLPESRPLLTRLRGVTPVYRRDQLKHWDFSTAVQALQATDAK